VHLEILPYLRMPGRLKYLAGSEIGAGAFTADTLPEEKAQELRRIEVRVQELVFGASAPGRVNLIG
jgi:UDPglucose--hexose-1-phosphate uridylyltransferase